MSADRESLLTRLLTGVLDPASDEARAAFDGDAGLREEYEALRGLEGQITAAVDEHRSALEEVARTSGAPGEQAVAGLMRAHFGQPERPAVPSGRGSNPWLRWLPIAVAAAIALVLWQRSPEPAPLADPGPVMGQGVRDLFPAGEVDQLTEFTWRADAARGSAYRVIVYNQGDSEPRRILTESGDLDEPRWIPDTQEIEAWPRTIHWEVHVLDGATPVGFGSATVSRR